jgi:hypothetical protein
MGLLGYDTTGAPQRAQRTSQFTTPSKPGRNRRVGRWNCAEALVTRSEQRPAWSWCGCVHSQRPAARWRAASFTVDEKAITDPFSGTPNGRGPRSVL